MAKYRKKPVVVEAYQWYSADHGSSYPSGVYYNSDLDRYYVITIHGGLAYLTSGDWIITEPDGVHHYPCKPDIFEATYELVKETKHATDQPKTD